MSSLLSRTDMLAGIASGFVQTTFGHPFDTTKVILQSDSKRPAAQQFALRNLYRGFWYPFAFNGAFSGLTFASNGYLRRRYCTNHFESGALTGALGAIIITPVDLYKVRAQSAGASKRRARAFPFRGFIPSLIREVPSSSVYFGLYHWLQQKKTNNPMLNGGVAGIACWLVSYPADTVKTRIQSGECRTIRQAVSQRRLWRGIVPCLIRSFIVNACGFYTYERFKVPLNDWT